MKFYGFPKIAQYKDAIREIRIRESYVGKDELGNAIYQAPDSFSTVTFKGTIKLHGTNASIVENNDGVIYAQSRNNIITPTDDNAGFARFVDNNQDFVKSLFSEIRNGFNLEKNTTVVIYGEWAGGNIQKNVGVANLQKSFFIFDIKVIDENENTKWLDIDSVNFLDVNTNNFYCITDFEKYTVDIDLNAPELTQNKLVDITIAVEKECPVAKHFGFDNTIGEGVVWRTILNDGHDIRYKIKGELHSVSKVKTLASVDEEKLATVKEFIDYAVTENRVRQGIQVVWGENPIDMSQMSDFMRWIVADVFAEETNAMTENGLDPKDMGKPISNAARTLFLKIKNSF